jgi:hypothetical protein
MTQAIDSEGVVLATNYMALDRATLGFWNALHERLQQRGLSLLMASTTVVEGASFSVLPIPYHLAGFADLVGDVPQPLPGMDEVIASSVMADRGTPYAKVVRGADQTFAFYLDLLRAIRPAAALIWNGMHAQSQVAMAACRLLGVPCWGAERGWIRDTMMFDLGENSALSEWGLSVSLHTVLKSAEPTSGVFERIREHHRARPVGRYGDVAFEEAAALRQSLGVPADVPLWAAFPHGGPGIDAGPTRAALHATSPDVLDAQLAEAARVAAQHGAILLVQEHPIAALLGSTRPAAQAAGARFVRVNMHSLLAAAELTLHSGSTVQFDALYYGRPMLLLNRSILSLARVGGRRGAFEVGVDGTVTECLHAALRRSDWDARQADLERLASLLATCQLVDVGAGIVPTTPDDLADVLARHRFGSPAGAEDRLADFFARWPLLS